MLNPARVYRAVSSKTFCLSPPFLEAKQSLFAGRARFHPARLAPPRSHHGSDARHGIGVCLAEPALPLWEMCGVCRGKVTEGRAIHLRSCSGHGFQPVPGTSCAFASYRFFRRVLQPKRHHFHVSCMLAETSNQPQTDAQTPAVKTLAMETLTEGTHRRGDEETKDGVPPRSQSAVADLVSRSQARDVPEADSSSIRKLSMSEIWPWAKERGIQLKDCCETDKKLKVAVLLSGGVDSSVALNLLLAAGHDCTCFYLKIWFQEDFRNFWSECPWEDDLRVAEEVCKSAGVELRVVHLTDEYWDRVVSHTVDEIRSGRTPNPDILCNSRVKFGAFLEKPELTQFDRVASGHYARLVRLDEGPVTLQLSADGWKDQTYFLSQMSQRQLAKGMFPLGGMTKPQVRELATSLALPNSGRKDSQGICFLGKVKFTEFVAEHLGESPGWILDAESGEYLGTHSGFWFYTIGQRQGLGLSGGPWYVVAKDTEHNVIFASRTYSARDMPQTSFIVGPINWISGTPPSHPSPLRCKVRHGPKLYDCRLEFSSQDRATVYLGEGDQGLAAGQYAAFYDGEVCLGSAVIVDATGGVASKVPSERAKEAAGGEGGPAKGRVRFDGLKRNVFGERAKSEAADKVLGPV